MLTKYSNSAEKYWKRRSTCSFIHLIISPIHLQCNYSIYLILRIVCLFVHSCLCLSLFLYLIRVDQAKPSVVKQILRLLSTPLETYKNILTVLKLEHYPRLLTFLTFENRKVIISPPFLHSSILPSFLSSNRSIQFAFWLLTSFFILYDDYDYYFCYSYYFRELQLILQRQRLNILLLFLKPNKSTNYWNSSSL